MVMVIVELPEGLAVSAVSSTWIVGAFDAGAVANTGSMTNKTDTRMSLFMAVYLLSWPSAEPLVRVICINPDISFAFKNLDANGLACWG